MAVAYSASSAFVERLVEEDSGDTVVSSWLAYPEVRAAPGGCGAGPVG